MCVCLWGGGLKGICVKNETEDVSIECTKQEAGWVERTADPCGRAMPVQTGPAVVLLRHQEVHSTAVYEEKSCFGLAAGSCEVQSSLSVVAFIVQEHSFSNDKIVGHFFKTVECVPFVLEQRLRNNFQYRMVGFKK